MFIPILPPSLLLSEAELGILQRANICVKMKNYVSRTFFPARQELFFLTDSSLNGIEHFQLLLDTSRAIFM